MKNTLNQTKNKKCKSIKHICKIEKLRENRFWHSAEDGNVSRWITLPITVKSVLAILICTPFDK